MGGINLAAILTENAYTVLEKRYLKKEQGRVVETPDDLFHRVAKNVAQAEPSQLEADETEKDFYELLTSLDFLPNSPTLMNAGRDLQQLSACFVIPVGDSMEEIFDAVKTMAVIQKSGGGTGFSFTRLRPSNDFVGSTSGVASGPVSFMKVFNETTETVKQGGCWVGDTLISTVEGNIPIKDLVGKQTWVYSWDHLGEKVTVKRTDGSWKTSDSKEIWELKTENGICIKGTLDHPIMLRSGEYRKLSELKTGTPLMPLRVERRKEDVYIRDRLLQGRRIRSNEARKILSHFVYEELTGESIPQGFVLHHKDGNHFNNRPENWELKMPNLHAFDHRKAQVQAGTHIFVNRVFPKFGQDNGMHKSNFWANKSESELLEYKKKIGSPGDLNPMRINSEARRKVSDYAKSREAKDAKLRGRILKLANKVLEAGYNWSDWSMALKNMGLPNHQRIRIDSVLRIFGSFECLDRSLKLSNDRVLSVKFIGYEAAYNLEVEDTHNYVVTNGTDPWSRGIFVSNTRRGANMAVLSVHHPDILKFISCKEDNDRLNNFNISVSATDVFMEAVKAGTEYDLINPRSGEVVKKLNAREVFDQIVYYAWKNGDPGIIFIDKINRDNPTPELGLIESTNPCGEQPLLPFESCNLGSINLAHMVYDGKIDWAKLRNVTQLAIHFLDNVIDMNHYTLPQIEEITKANRKIGLGVMGWSDMLIQLGLPYAEPRSLKLADEVMLTIATEARQESAKLGKERGSFPNFDNSTLKGKYKTMRNATVTTIAPTGSISLIAGCSSGIEPMFAVAFKSVRLDNTELLEVNPFFRAIAEEKGFYSEDLMSKIVEAGTLKDFKDIPPNIKKVFATAHDISPEDHIKMQAVFQKHIDNAVSKTINFPKDATADEVAKVYLLAFDTDCKGVTIYRDMSRETQVLYKGSSSGKTPQRSPAPKRRGDVTKGYTKKVPTGCGSLYVTLNEDEETGQLFEVFARIGKAGGCASSQSEAVGRLASMALRAGMDPEEVIEQLRSISCHTPAWSPGGKVMSCADAISKALEWYQGTKKEEAEEVSTLKRKKKNVLHRGACPNCGGNLMYMEGCAKCLCGYSECG